MRKLTFDSEHLTYCPMNKTATIRECLFCKYCRNRTAWINDGHDNPMEVCTTTNDCIYRDVFPEELPNLSEALKKLHKMTPDLAKHIKAVMKEAE